MKILQIRKEMVQMAIKIAITYEKGGVGKTTTAVNLSAILAEKGYKVLLADLDLQSYATSYFDMYDDKLPCIYEVMCEDNPVTAEDAVRSTGIERLDLLPSNYRFRKMETVLMMKTKRQEYTLKKCLSEIEKNYDFIIFDSPPNSECIKENTLAYVNYKKADTYLKMYLPKTPFTSIYYHNFYKMNYQFHLLFHNYCNLLYYLFHHQLFHQIVFRTLYKKNLMKNWIVCKKDILLELFGYFSYWVQLSYKIFHIK